MVIPVARTKVFISYSRQDQAALESLQIHLRPLEREGLLERWDDTVIQPGQIWINEIQQAIGAARVAVLLVSANFLASDFIANNELPPLLKAAEHEGLVVLPVILRWCLFTDTPNLSQFQPVNDPSEPLSDLEESQQDRIWVKVSRAIKKALNEPLPSLANSPAAILARQVQDWFDVLGYNIEDHEFLSEEYFEWIILIPTRQGYDRVLIQCIAGEAKIKHVRTLQQVVQKHRTGEGWLIFNRRISPAARSELNKYKDLCCYTLDELIDQNADFSHYLDSLEKEIEQKGIDTDYIPLACTKDEIEPTTGQKIGTSRYEADNGWIEGYVDQWLDDPAKEHLSILGEFGTGKTWFALHYSWTILTKYKDAKARGIERPRLPLVIPLRNYAKAVSVESLFSEFFFREHEIPLPGYTAFEQLNRMGKLLLIFDGFDEMAARVNRQAMINNFWELAKVVVPGSKAILTCRTEHFPEAKEGRQLLNAELEASTSNLTGEPPQFEVLELEKFSNEQIEQVLSQKA